MPSCQGERLVIIFPDALSGHFAVPDCLCSSHLGQFLLNFCPWENAVFISYPEWSYKEREEEGNNDITCPEVKGKAT